jgi:hypothetical protein
MVANVMAMCASLRAKDRLSVWHHLRVSESDYTGFPATQRFNYLWGRKIVQLYTPPRSARTPLLFITQKCMATSLRSARSRTGCSLTAKYLTRVWRPALS